MNIHDRLCWFLKERGWSRYKLAKECDLSESTITNIFKRRNTPAIGTLEIICKGLNITLSQFFAENDMTELTPELKQVFNEWIHLTPKQREAILITMKAMRNKE